MDTIQISRRAALSATMLQVAIRMIEDGRQEMTPADITLAIDTFDRLWPIEKEAKQ